MHAVLSESRVPARRTSGRHNITVAEYISQQVNLCGKSQLEIAREAGFNKPNIITMIKQGKTKLPTAKIGPMAHALGVDPVHLYQLVMQEYEPENWEALNEYVLRAPLITDNEMEIINLIRRSNVSNPKIRTEEEKAALLDVISRLKPENAVLGD
jgi:hypothetical protein